METKRANLITAMGVSYPMCSRVRGNLQELLYTASETYIIEHSMSAEEAYDIVMLYELAMKLSIVPDELRM